MTGFGSSRKVELWLPRERAFLSPRSQFYRSKCYCFCVQFELLSLVHVIHSGSDSANCAEQADLVIKPIEALFLRGIEKR